MLAQELASACRGRGGSRTEYPEALATAHGQPEGPFEGSAWLVDYRHGDRDWAWFATYQDLDPDGRSS